MDESVRYPVRPGICFRGERELKWRLRGRHHSWLAGNSNAARLLAYDAYVRKYDTNGNLQWTRQFGTADNDVAYGAFADATGMYVVGYTKSVLGTASLGGADVFLRRYDSNGNALWTLQTGSVDDDYGYGVAADVSGIYIGGYTDSNSIPESLTNGADPFLYKYSPPAPGGPVILEGAIVNNASFATSPAPVAPGSIAAIFGTGLNDGSQVLFSSFGAGWQISYDVGGRQCYRGQRSRADVLLHVRATRNSDSIGVGRTGVGGCSGNGGRSNQPGADSESHFGSAGSVHCQPGRQGHGGVLAYRRSDAGNC